VVEVMHHAATMKECMIDEAICAEIGIPDDLAEVVDARCKA
jgi:hypothetical protein